MASNSVTITWLLPFMTLAPIGLAHCIESTEKKESTEIVEPTDGGQMKTPPDGGQKTMGDSGMKTQGDASTKQPPDGATPPGDAGGPGTPPDAGGPANPPDAGGAPHDPGSVPCNGAPCDVSHGYVCCVTWTSPGTTEACKPPHSVCLGHTIACDEEADCDDGVCCQDFPSGGLAGSAWCKASCDAHICR
jgi:hypothetical protein